MEQAVEADDEPLTADDERLVREFIGHEQAEGKSTGSIYMKVDHVVRFARRAGVSLTELTTPEVQTTLDAMGSGQHPEVKNEGIHLKNYQNALRMFYGFHDDLNVTKSDIALDQPEGRNLTPDDLLYAEEVDALLEACQRSNIRDMAFVALALATGQRIDAIRTLRLKHVRTRGPTMEVKLNEEEGALKGASGTKPLLWAKHYVRPWYESHPHRGNPDAALFCPNTPQGAGAQDGDATEPMHAETFRTNLKRRAEEAGLEKDVYPHLLRHCAITRMVQEGLSEQQIKQTAGWSLDSSQFDTYSNLADELNNDTIREALGMPTTGEQVWVGRPSLDECTNCGERIPEGDERCPTCDTAITHREHIQGGETVRKPAVDEIERAVSDMGPAKAAMLAEKFMDRVDRLNAKMDQGEWTPEGGLEGLHEQVDELVESGRMSEHQAQIVRMGYMRDDSEMPGSSP